MSKPSPSREQRADKVALIEEFDHYSALRRGLGRAAALHNEWAGIPMPLDGERLVIEPKFKDGAELAAIGVVEKEPLPDGVVVRNIFWSRRLRSEIYIWNEPDAGGRVRHSVLPMPHHLGLDLRTLGCSIAWGIEQESNALKLLGTLIRHHQMKQYLLTGMFLETSKRSKVTYLFRKLRPTVAIDAKDSSARHCRILAALCMHPIAYYAESWAGAMCPTDDVVAHLMLMRADEHMFWRRCNQHPPDRPEAGL